MCRACARAHPPAPAFLQAAAPELKLIGYKAYYSNPGKGSRYHVHLLDTDTGNLVAMIEASHLGMVRTGAASGVATQYHGARGRHDCRHDRRRQTGGRPARSGVRGAQDRRGQGLQPQNRESAQISATTMSARLRHKDGSRYKRGRSRARRRHHQRHHQSIESPVLLGEWLEPGQHINAAGSNALTRREIDAAGDQALRASSSIRAAPRATNAAICCRSSRAACSTGTRCPNSASDRRALRRDAAHRRDHALRIARHGHPGHLYGRSSSKSARKQTLASTCRSALKLAAMLLNNRRQSEYHHRS